METADKTLIKQKNALANEGMQIKRNVKSPKSRHERSLSRLNQTGLSSVRVASTTGKKLF